MEHAINIMVSTTWTFLGIMTVINGQAVTQPPNWKERSLVDPGVTALGGIVGWQIKSYGIEFAGTSYLDYDKQADQAFLDGNSWMANRFTDQNPMLYGDFKQTLNVCGFVISGRPTWENDFVELLKLYLSNDNATWIQAQDRLGMGSVEGVPFDITGGGFIPLQFNYEAWNHISSMEFSGVQNGRYYRTNILKNPMMGRYVKVEPVKHIPGAAVAIRVGFIYDCIYSNFCDPNPCVNGGTCSGSYGTYSCQCPSGFSGLHCQNTDVVKDDLPKVCSLLDSEPQTYKNCICYCPDHQVFTTNTSTPIEYAQFTCETDMREYPKFDQFADFLPMPIKCPPGNQCAFIQSRVWGSPHMYTDDSAVCKAAVQTFGPEFLQEDTVIYAYKVGVQQYYPKFEQFGVQSVEYTRAWPGFTLLKAEADKIEADKH